MQIFLEHVRSFATKRSVPVRPLTLLVGENSSGKSTFLSVVSAVLDASRFPASPGFNEPPYNLGTFDTIATYKGGKYGRDESFSIGFSEGQQEDREHREVIATYGSSDGNVVLRRLRAKSAVGALDLSTSGNTLSGTLRLATRNGKGAEPIEFERRMRGSVATALQPFLFEVMDAIFEPRQLPERTGTAGRRARYPTPRRVFDVLEAVEPPYASSSSFAPIRSKPRRTYDELSEEYNPEGDHVPTLLAKLWRQEPRSVNARRVQEALVRFGKESGLFKKIDVRSLGKKASDPFQLQVTVGGPPANLTDVGYGISQALPIVVQSALKTTSKVMLMQQPEVHLHPRAQAALGTFFAELVAHDDRIALIETHSDHLVDRVRQEVATGKLSPESVLILFFHRPKLETSIQPLTLDLHGNVQNAPPAYRSFFLEEELRLFSRTDT